MYNLGDGHGGPFVSANLEGHQSIYMLMYLFWWKTEVETKARRGPSPKLYITILLIKRLVKKSKDKVVCQKFEESLHDLLQKNMVITLENTQVAIEKTHIFM